MVPDTYSQGYCKHCGACAFIDEVATEAQANEAATLRCDCSEAKEYQAVAKSVKASAETINEYFGENSKDELFDSEMCGALQVIARKIAVEDADTLTIKAGRTTCKIARSKVGLKIEREDKLTEGVEV